MKILIKEIERGFLFKNGKYAGLLQPGKHRTSAKRQIDRVNLYMPISSLSCSLDTLLKDPEVAKQSTSIEVGDCQFALHYVNGKFNGLLTTGKYAFWTVNDQHTFTMVDATTPEVSADVPLYVFSRMQPHFYKKIEIAEYEKGRLYFDKKFVRILDAGTYYFWENSVKVEVHPVDTRLTKMEITGQEILTQDKVSIRINFVCNYRITDYVRILTEINNFEEQIHVASQLALRDYVGKYRIDEILESKQQLSQYVYDRLKEKETDFFVTFTDAGVKDIILPGEIRDIMNTVLIAEKKAQANVITRREEVASTRSLLNTAKLLDENKTLYKLKELEYIERICENVGNITVGGNGDLLSQLTAVLRGN